MADPLRTLLDLPEQEKTERGLEHTPREIWQQPDTWSKTYQRCQDRQRRVERCSAARGNRPRQYFFAHRIPGGRGHVGLHRPSAGSVAAPAMELRGLANSQHHPADRI